jgi:hypothetical protein
MIACFGMAPESMLVPVLVGIVLGRDIVCWLAKAVSSWSSAARAARCERRPPNPGFCLSEMADGWYAYQVRTEDSPSSTGRVDYTNTMRLRGHT